MTEQDDTGTTLPLAEGFAPATAEQWWGLVGAVLRRSGGLPQAPDPATAEAMLSTTTYDGVRIRPLYTADDAAPDSGFPGVAPYVRGTRPTSRGKEGWDVRQYFADPDATATRQAVLTDLENGVTSLWLGVGAGGLAAGDLPEVLTDVLLDLAPVVLDAGAGTADAASQLMALWRDRLTDPAAALGNLGLDPLAVQARTGAAADLSALEPLVSRCLGEHPRVRAVTVDALAYHEAGGSDAQELGCALAAGVAYLRALEERGFAPDVACGQLEFRYAATADQFLTIAKLRAARRLWSRVTELSGVPAAARGQVQHAVTSASMMTRRDPWVNMLRATLACFGAATGGAQAVTVLPFDSAVGLPTTFSRRIARNTQALLAEESHIARVADPAGGSWYVETLTEELARTGAGADLSAVGALVSQTLADHPRVRAMTVDALPYHGAGGSDAQELGCALAAGVAYLRALEERGFSPEVACGQLEFRYAATADQFLTIAKLRAARRLWSRVTELSGMPAAHRGQVQHAVTSEPMMTRRDPWVNMLRTTLACFGAATGGAQAVTVLPFDAAIGLPTTFSRRIARNTHALLAEESNIARVADPAGGSWYVETLTEDLARTAWEWFRRIEREGGLGAALRSGLVADELAATAATRKEQVAHRVDPVTGVSEFPLHGEKPLQRKPFPATSTSASAPAGLPRLRRATAFEALADRAASFARATGSPPRVFLANIGPMRSHAARAGFAANLFWAGGIEVERGEGGSPEEVVAAFRASGATAACLCGSDRQYAEQGAEVAAALTAAGATWLALAGAPGDRESSYRQAGVETFLFAGCDAVDVLGRTLDGLGVPA